MSYGSINNPYVQPPRQALQTSDEESLNRLFRLNNSNHPAPKNVLAGVLLPILDPLSQGISSISWNPPLVEGLTQLALRCILEDLVESAPADDPTMTTVSSSEGSLVLLSFLTLAMEEWSDELIYLALTQSLMDHAEKSNLAPLRLVGLFIRLATAGAETEVVQQLAFTGLSTVYRSMDRLDRYLTLDVLRPDLAWWLDDCVTEDVIAKLSAMAVNLLLSPQNTASNGPSQKHRCQPYAEQLEIAATSYLCTILKRDLLSGYVFRDDQEVDSIYRLSLHQTQQILTSLHLTPNHISRRRALHVATLHAALMNLIQWRHDINMNEYEAMVKSTLFVDSVIAYLRPSPATPTTDQSSQHETSIWSREERNSQGDIRHALDLVDCWALSGGLEWEELRVKHEKHWRSSITKFWNHALAHETNQMIPLVPEIVLLHSRGRLLSRAVLHSICKGTGITSNNDLVSLKETTRVILSVLVELLQSTKLATKVQVASLLRVLLSDRCSLSTHDDFSRALWENLDAGCLETILNCALRFSEYQGVSRPLTLALMDLMDTLLQDTENCDRVLNSLSTERLECLVTMVECKKIKFDFKDGARGWDDLSLDLDSDTPPAQNLSRLDEASICVEQEDALLGVGLDTTIQLSCATTLARLGYTYSSLTEEGLRLMKARACNVVIDFVSGFYSGSGQEAKSFLSFDHNKRALRLQLAVGISENEDLIATALFSGQLLQQRLYWERFHASQATKLKLKAAEDRVTKLERHVKKLTAQNRSQSIVVNRELIRLRENTSQDSKQLVAIHATERSIAENRVAEYRLQLEKVDSQFQDALVQVAESERAVSTMRDELRHALAKIDEAENENKELSRQIELERVRSNELKEVIDSQNEKLDSLVRTKEQLEEELHGRDQAVEAFETTNERLRDDLEELFADMVSLATVYESKETEVTAMNRSHHDDLEAAHRDLRREKERSKALQKTCDELKELNEKLQRKLEKYKQRLQDEQRDREEESVRRKRNGPVSYMNQLHQSTSLDRSRDRSTIKESGSNSRSRLEKENSSSYTSSSLNRKSNY